MNPLDITLSEIFDLPASNTEVSVVEEFKEQKAQSERLFDKATIKEDVDLAREAMRDAIKIGVEAINDLVRQASSSQDVEAYAALASLIKSINETNINIVELHEKTATIEATIEPETKEAAVVNQNLIISSHELIEAIQNASGRRALEAAQTALIYDDNDTTLQQ